MKRSTWSTMCLVAILCIGLAAPLVMADRGKHRDKHEDEDKRLSVHAAFGRGLNTAQAGNAVNHVILPNQIEVDQGGIVHFLVSGFHQVVVYKPGTELKDIQDFASALATTVTFIDFAPDQPFYLGIPPAGGPQNTAGTINPLNGSNRVESVSFPTSEGVVAGTAVSAKAEPGIYLVICNVRAHFLDGMFAFVEVKAEDEDD
jgi:hypothetical protein